MALIAIGRHNYNVKGRTKRRTGYFRLGGIHIWRFHRAAWFRHEWYNYGGTRYFSFGIAHPRVHTRWAFNCIIYLP